MTYERAKAETLTFFGTKCCVVTDDDAITVDWHHLDCDRDNNTKYNLIPITTGIHQGYHRDPKKRGAAGISLDEINEKAWVSFDKGWYKRAYGAQRFLSFAVRPKDWNLSLRYSVGALTSLRPLYAVDFAVDTLSRSVLPSLRESSPLVQSLLAMEISMWLRDSGDADGGAFWLEVALALAESVKWADAQTRLQYARLLMIQTVSKILKGDSSALDDVARVRESTDDYRAGRGNADLWEAMFHLWKECPHAFCDIIDKSISCSLPDSMSRVTLYPGTRLAGTTYWTLAQTLLAQADSAAHRGKEDERIHYAGLAHELFLTTEIVPAGNLSRASLDWYQKRHNLPMERRIRIRAASALAPLYPVLDTIRSELGSP